MATVVINIKDNNAESKLKKIRHEFEKTDKSITNITSNLKTYIAGFASLAIVSNTLQSVTKDFKLMETATSEIAKTTGLSGEALKDLTSELDRMSVTMSGFEVKGLYDIAASAGQLGIKGVENIKNFSKEMQYMASSSKLTAEESAVGFAKLANSLKVPIKDINKLTSSFSALASSTTADEGQLLDWTQRLSAAGTNIKLANSEIIAIGASLHDVGINAEVGGTAISDMFNKMLLDTEKFAHVSGVSLEEFSTNMKEKPIKAVKALLLALSKMDAESKVKALQDLGLGAGGAVTSILKLSTNLEGLEANLKTSSNAWADGRMTLLEYLASSKDLVQVQKQADSSVRLLKVAIGERLKPAYLELNNVIIATSTFLKDNMSTIVAIIPQVTALGLAFATWKALGAMLPFLKTQLLNFTTTLAITGSTFETVGIGASVLGEALGVLGAALKRLLIVNAPLLAIVAIFETWSYITGENTKKQEEFNSAMSVTVDEMKNLTNAQRSVLEVQLTAELQKGRETLGEMNRELRSAETNMGGFFGATQEEVNELQAQVDTQHQANNKIRRQIGLLREATANQSNVTTEAGNTSTKIGEASNNTTNLSNGLNSSASAANNAANNASNIAYQVKIAASEAYNLTRALEGAASALSAQQTRAKQLAGEISRTQALAENMKNQAADAKSKINDLVKMYDKLKPGDEKGLTELNTKLINAKANELKIQNDYKENLQRISEQEKRATQKAYKSSIAKAKHDARIKAKIAKQHAKAVAKKVKLEDNFNDFYNKNTLSSIDYEKKSLNKKLDQFAKNGNDKKKIAELREKGIADIEKKYADKKAKEQARLTKKAESENKKAQNIAKRKAKAEEARQKKEQQNLAKHYDKIGQSDKANAIREGMETNERTKNGASEEQLRAERIHKEDQDRYLQRQKWFDMIGEIGKAVKNENMMAVGTLSSNIGKFFNTSDSPLKAMQNMDFGMMGSAIDMLTNSQTKSAEFSQYGGALGSIAGTIFGNPAVGQAIGSGIGAVIGGLFGSTKDKGFRIGEGGIDDISKWKQKKSWISKKNKYSDLNSWETQGIRDAYDAYSQILDDFNIKGKMFIHEGNYKNLGSAFIENFYSVLEKDFKNPSVDIGSSVSSIAGGLKDYIANVNNFIVNPDEIANSLQSWKDYAKSVDKDVSEIFLNALNKFSQFKTSFKDWSIGFNKNDNLEQLKFREDIAKRNLDKIKKDIGEVESVNVYNFLDRMKIATKSLDKQDIEKWTQLGEALKASAIAKKRLDDKIIKDRKDKLKEEITLWQKEAKEKAIHLKEIEKNNDKLAKAYENRKKSAIQTLLGANSYMNTPQKMEYSKNLYENAYQSGNKDDALNYGKQYLDFLSQYSRNDFEIQQAQTQYANRFGAETQTQQVEDKKQTEEIKNLKVELGELKATIKDQTDFFEGLIANDGSSLRVSDDSAKYAS